MKNLTNKYAILIILLISILGGCNLPESPRHKKYTAHIGNWVGGSSYECDYYKRDGNTYQLFDKDSILVTEITLTAGYRIVINKNY